NKHITPTYDKYTLTIHDALPIFKQSSDGHIQIKSISKMMNRFEFDNFTGKHNNDYSQLLQIIYEYGKKDKEELKNSMSIADVFRSEEHTSELKSRFDLV